MPVSSPTLYAGWNILKSQLSTVFPSQGSPFLVGFNTASLPYSKGTGIYFPATLFL